MHLYIGTGYIGYNENDTSASTINQLKEAARVFIAFLIVDYVVVAVAAAVCPPE